MNELIRESEEFLTVLQRDCKALAQLLERLESAKHDLRK
jgi:hypothetical protein